MNSALKDKDYRDKKIKIQEQLNRNTIESLKALLLYSKYKDWNEKSCIAHHREMMRILSDSLKITKDKEK